MNILTKQVILGLLITSLALPTFAYHGVYVGGGGSGNSINEDFNSFIFSSTNKSARDSYNVTSNQLSPMLQVGYWNLQPHNWLWGVVGQWKYLHYLTTNVDSSQGQHIPNASFSSINFFGPKIERDFASQTKITNEFLLLFYLGMQFSSGNGYLGLGSALLSASNHIYLNSIHTPDGVGDNLITTSVNRNKTMFGGAVQIGYNYFLDTCWFLNVNYTYLKTVKTSFDNSINAAIYNGASVPGPTTLTLNRHINISSQEVMLSINKLF